MLVLQSRLLAQKNNANKLDINYKITNTNLIKDQEYLFNAIKESIKKNKKIILKQISQITKQIKGFDFTLRSKNYLQKSINEEIQELQRLYSKRLINKIELRSLQREESSLNAEITNLNEEKRRFKDKISELKDKILLIDKDFQKETLEELTLLTPKISKLKSEIDTLKDKLIKTTIFSPSDGYIVGLTDYSQDSIIKANSDILEIIPNNSDLIILGRIKSTDICY